MNFVYSKVLFAELKNKLSVLSSSSYLYYEPQKKKKKRRRKKNVLDFRTFNLPLKYINRVGVLKNNAPAI